MILRQNIHALKQLFVVSDRERFLLRLLFTEGEEKERQPPFLLVVGFWSFCVCFVFRVLYIYKTLEELEIERSRGGEKKSFEVGGLND